MPNQFDVFINPLSDRAAYPLLVVLQSPFAELAKTRIVAPAVRLRPEIRIGGVLTPRFTIDGNDYVLHIFQLTSVKVTDLKRRVGNIADARDAITRALDHLFHDNA
jgi:toxin CcdB